MESEAVEQPVVPALPPFPSPAGWQRGFAAGIAWLKASRVELAWLGGIMAVAVVVRLHQLGSIPYVISGDETDNLQDAYHILRGTGPGLFGLDWKPAPILSLYPLAWIIGAFGDSVAVFRLFPVILSLLTLAAFYLVARQVVSHRAALPALLLMATNLWVLHFSRTAWENMNAALFALGACFAVSRALQTGKSLWWGATGVFVALGFYGYFSGRLIVLSVVVAAVLAIAFRLVSWKPALRGLALAGTVSAILAAPLALTVLDNWDHFNKRTQAVSILNGDPYEGETNPAALLVNNGVRTAKAFLLLDADEFGRGLWARYNPANRGPLDLATSVLFWGGLVVAAVRWRKSYVWLTLFIPLGLTQVLSRDTPDLARAIVGAPVYFLLIALFFHEVLQRISHPLRSRAAMYSITAVVVYLSMVNVGTYFNWQQQDDVQSSRLPGVAGCEFETWRAMALEAAAAGRSNLNAARFDEVRRELRCSPIVNVWLGLEEPATPTLPELGADAPPDDRRRRDIARLHAALLEFGREHNGSYPSTGDRVQSLCTFRELDAGCVLESVLKPIPRDPQNEGYWYRSDGDIFTLYAELESEGTCPALPEGFFRNPANIICITGR